MSVHATSWVLRNSAAELGDRLVLLVLADYAGEDGSEARPGVSTIARETRLSERQVQRNLRRLEAAGSITQTGVHHSGARIYSLQLGGDILSPLPAEGVTSEASRGDVGVTRSTLEPPLDPSGQAKETIRPRNVVWDALVEVYGAPSTKSETRNFGKTVSEVREALVASGLEEECWRVEIIRRATSVEPQYRTHTSLRNRWGQMGGVDRPAGDDEPVWYPPLEDAMEPCGRCEGTGKRGDEDRCFLCGGTGKLA